MPITCRFTTVFRYERNAADKCMSFCKSKTIKCVSNLFLYICVSVSTVYPDDKRLSILYDP